VISDLTATDRAVNAARILEVQQPIREGKDPDESARLTEPEPMWNTKVAVVMNLRAKDASAAGRRTA
jgi:hypothetical protein